MWLYLSIFLLALGSSSALDPFPYDAYERIRNFKPGEISHTSEDFFPTWTTILKVLNQNPQILSSQASTPSVSQTCLDDWTLIWNITSPFQNRSDPTNWNYNYSAMPFIQMIDSSATLGPGILKGHQWYYGLYSECHDISYELPSNPPRKFEGLYTRIFISQNIVKNPAEADYRDPGACDTVMGIDICFPRSCTDDDLLHLVRTILESTERYVNNVTAIMQNITDGINGKPMDATASPNILDPICRIKTMRDEYFKKYDAGTWIVVTIMGIIIILGVTASIYDYFIFPLHKNELYLKHLGVRCWRAFSLYTNISETFNTKGSKKAGQIGPIHCMRFFSLCWVVMGHSLGFFMLFSSNPLDVANITKDYTLQWVINAYFAVDTFFFQSGLLMAFIWFKKYQQNPRQTNSIGAWVMFYVHRILRLSPAYYILIAFYTFVYLPWLDNMPVYLSPFDEPCPQNWWVNYLYLNNFIRYDRQCYLVSWYLSTDLQIYIFAPILIVPFVFGPLLGIAAASIVFIISTVANLVEVIHYRFPASDFSLAPMDPKMTVPYSHYTALIYNAPWIRCQIFIIGFLVGWFLQNKKKLKIHWALNILGWLICFTLMILDIIALRSWAGEGHYMDLGLRALYSAFAKPVWGICLAWIIISCYYGHGSFINDFMSWNIWVPLGRLSYSAYLIHICVMLFITGMSQNGTTFFSFPQMFLLFSLPVIFGAYFLAIFWSALFEFGFGKVEDILIGRLIGRSVRSAPPPPKPEVQAEAIITSPVKESNGWEVTNGEAKPAYANSITINGKEDKEEKED